MALDSNGVWIYEESDSASPFSDTLNLLADSTSDAIGDVNARVTNLIPVTPWTSLALNTPRYKLYGSGGDGPVSYMRWGRMVQIHGTVGPGDATAVAAINGTNINEDNRIATLPVGARPGKGITAVMQGSGSDRWALWVSTVGGIHAYRYGPSASATTTWMPFDLCFLTN